MLLQYAMRAHSWNLTSCMHVDPKVVAVLVQVCSKW